jgi:DNA-binding transcriptional regulator of glucitol operon
MKTPWRLLDIIVVLLVTLLMGWNLWKHFNPDMRTIQTTPQVTTVYVDKPVLTDRIVEKIVSDPKDKAIIKSLMAENAKLSVRVTALSQTIAETQSHGGGILTTTPPVEATLTAPAVPASVHFKDWRLDFRANGDKAAYDLTQKFEVLATTGRDKDGKNISLVKLFELGANGERLPAASLTTTAIFADDTKPHWIIHPAIQAGLAITNNERGAVVGVQWLKRGRTKAAEDSTLALLTPVAFVSQNVKEVGVLPLSVNLGLIKYMPLKDFWVSPYVGADLIKRTPSRVGLTLTATF